MLVELRRALGIIAASERRPSKDPLGPLINGDGARPKSKRARLELDLARYEALKAWHKDLVKQHGRKLKAIRGKSMKMPVDPELGEDECSEAEKAADAAELREHMARLRLGGGGRRPAYLDDPRLEPTNNFSERMLRLEKLIEASSHSCSTLEGRFALDIMRSVLQTAVAAHAPLQRHILSVLRASPAEVAAAPTQFTPREWVAQIAPPPAAP